MKNFQMLNLEVREVTSRLQKVNKLQYNFSVIVNVKSYLCRPSRHIGGADVWLHSFLTSALDVIDIKPPAALTPAKTPGTHCTGGCLGRRDDMNPSQKKKTLFRLSGFEPRTLQPVA